MSDSPEEPTAVERTALVVRVHCVIEWPAGPRCNNCHLSHPCPSYRQAIGLLVADGWSWARIAALDTRRGVWS
jgi:hypothetical protein